MRTLTAMIATLVAAALGWPAAAGAQSLDLLPAVQRTVSAPALTTARCDRPAGALTGVGRTTWAALVGGYVTVTLQGASGSDWDLGLFDAGGQRLGGSLSFGPREIAQAWVKAGQALTVQACRRSGAAQQAAVTIAPARVSAPAVGGAPQLVSVAYDDRADLERIADLGVDLTHHVRDGRADVIVANAAERARLIDAGFDVTTKIADLTDFFHRSQAADARYGIRVAKGEAPVPPSGRTTYRVLTDYQADMKSLAERYPAIVKPMKLPGRSYQGRELEGVEIAENVHAAAEDGRPVYLVVALHHAREWPSAEAAMEFAIMLAKGYGTNGRITSLLRSTRVVVVPLINPDGFVTSRGFPADPADVLGGGGDHAGLGIDPNLGDPCAGSPLLPAPTEACQQLRTCALTGDPPCEFDFYLTEGIAPPGGIFSYRRKNCAGSVPDPRTPCELQHGVDPNRNYGQFWGGPGSDGDVTSQGYRGPSPWSEPETQAVHQYSQRRQITSIITLHNVAALVLRPPGTSTGGLAPDEPRLKQIGDAMAAATGYTSQYGFQLYDTAGTTEDWNYAAQGAYGYTIEVGPAGGEFHMPYETGFVKEWTGDSDAAGGRGGLREALLVAGEAAASSADHAVISGRTAAGRVLRVRKDFTTPSWGEPFCRNEIPLLLLNVPATDGPRCLDLAQPFSVDDHLETTLTVPSSGRFAWHVNPSTRPFELKEREVPGEITQTMQTFIGSGEVAPTSAEVDPAGSETEHTFVVGATDGTQSLGLDLAWEVPAEDFDLRLCRVVSETQCDPIGTGTDLGASGNPPGSFEHIAVDAPPVGTYRATVVRYATARDDYTLTVTRSNTAGSSVVPGRREPWILTCETSAGTVLQRAEVIVDRGQTASVDLKLCGKTG
jgi:hypothetical protein